MMKNMHLAHYFMLKVQYDHEKPDMSMLELPYSDRIAEYRSLPFLYPRLFCWLIIPLHVIYSSILNLANVFRGINAEINMTYKMIQPV